jgi:predicted transcriptional regulator
MSKALSLKLRNDVFARVEKMTRQVHMPRNTYINRALDFYTSYNERKLLRKQLQKESFMVRENSAELLYDFEKMEDDLIA